MTSKINALSTGAGGIATTADASGILEIQTNSTTAMPDADYCVAGAGGLLSTRALLIGFGVNASPTTTAARISSTTSNTATPTDGDYIAISIFR